MKANTTNIKPIDVTFFTDEYAKTLTTESVDIWNLRDRIKTTSADKKEKLPWLKLAEFGKKCSDEGCLRINENVLSISGVEADYDGGKIDIATAVVVFKKARLHGLIYASPSHTPKKPRWRILCQTSCKLEPAERTKLLARLQGVFGDIFAPESFTLSQAYYYGSVNSNPAHFCEYYGGDYIDLRDDLDEVAIGRDGKPFTGEEQHVSGEPQADPELVAACVAEIPNKNPKNPKQGLEWNGWNNRLMAIWRATGGSEAGFEIADAFSKKAKDKYDSAETRKRWRHYSKSPPNRIGFGTLHRMADEASPGWRAAYEAELLERAYAVMAELGKQRKAKSDKTSKTKSDKSKTQNKKTTASASTPPGMKATPFTWIDPANIPQRQWLYRPGYIRQFTSATFSPGGVGKSSLIIVETMAMASDKPLLGIEPEQQLRVWYFNGEDPQDELQRRFAAVAKHYKITKRDIDDHLFVDSGRTMPIVIARDSKSGTTIAQPVIEEVIATLINNKIDVLIIDPFISIHRVSENDNNAIEVVAKIWSRIAEAANCAIMLVHHTRKAKTGSGNEATVDDARGASALVDAVRYARLLNTMSKTEAEELAVNEKDRRRYFKVDGGKANLTRPAEQSDWFFTASVPLGNGTNGLGDEVGVVEKWNIPDDVHPRLGVESILAIQAAFKAGGPWREDKRSKIEPWGGVAYAEALSLDPTRTGQKTWIEKGLRALIRAGYLARVVKPDSRREMRAYIEATDTVPPKDAEVVFS